MSRMRQFIALFWAWAAFAPFRVDCFSHVDARWSSHGRGHVMCFQADPENHLSDPDNLSNPSDKGGHRRHFLRTGLSVVTSGLLLSPQRSLAAITDETDTFANNYWTKDGATTSSSSLSTAPTTATQSNAMVSDEIMIRFSKADLAGAGLGLELADIEFRTNRRVFVKSIRPGSLAERLGIQTDWIVVSLNGQSTERTNAQGVAMMLQTALKQAKEEDTFNFVFRDPFVFREQLNNLGKSTDGSKVTTQVAPAGDTSQRFPDGSLRPGRVETSQMDQKITVEQLKAPRLCTKGAEIDDLLEISYLGTVVETGQVFDGSAIKINGQAVPGRGDDVTLFFVLGKQPFGQFPPGWDTGLYGMCVGERRRLILPPVLAYGSTGMPRRGIPPDSTLQYDITLVSLNGLATPQ
eukprot:scaffold34637_cov187-Amphora_coffeaeformis.AAC.3